MGELELSCSSRYHNTHSYSELLIFKKIQLKLVFKWVKGCNCSNKSIFWEKEDLLLHLSLHNKCVCDIVRAAVSSSLVRELIMCLK